MLRLYVLVFLVASFMYNVVKCKSDILIHNVNKEQQQLKRDTNKVNTLIDLPLNAIVNVLEMNDVKCASVVNQIFNTQNLDDTHLIRVPINALLNLLLLNDQASGTKCRNHFNNNVDKLRANSPTSVPKTALPIIDDAVNTDQQAAVGKPLKPNVVPLNSQMASQNTFRNSISGTAGNAMLGNGDKATKLIGASVPVVANAIALSPLTAQGSNKLTNTIAANAGNDSGQLVGASLPIATSVLALNPVTAIDGDNRIRNTLSGNMGNAMRGNNNAATQALNAAVPLAANVLALNKVTSVGGSNIIQNKVAGDADHALKGSKNAATELIGAGVPVSANVLALNPIIARDGSNTLTNNLAGNIGNSNRANKLVGAGVPVAANVLALDTLKAGRGSNTLTNNIMGNVGNSMVAANVPIAANVLALDAANAKSGSNTITNTISGNAGNKFTGNNSNATQLVGARVPVIANVLALNSVKATNGSNTISNRISGGTGNAKVANADVTAAINSPLLSNIESTGQNASNVLDNTVNAPSGDVVTGNRNLLGGLLNLGGNVLGNLLVGNSITAKGRNGSATNTISNTVKQRPQTVIKDNDSLLLKPVTGNVNALLNVLALDKIVGKASDGHANNTVGNTVNRGPSTVIEGSNDVVVNPINADLNVLGNILALDKVLGLGGGSNKNAIDNKVKKGPNTLIKGDNNRMLQFLNIDGDILASVPLLNKIVSGGNGTNGLENNINKGPSQVIVGKNNKVVRLINVDADVIADVAALDTLEGKCGHKIKNKIKKGPRTKVDGNGNVVTNLIDLNLDILADVTALTNILGLGVNCKENETVTSMPTVLTTATSTPKLSIPAPAIPGFQTPASPIQMLPTLATATPEPSMPEIQTSAPTMIMLPTQATATPEPLMPELQTSAPVILMLPTQAVAMPALQTQAPPFPLSASSQQTHSILSLAPTALSPISPALSPSPSPKRCYRRYCRKWRIRPSFICKNGKPSTTD